MSTRYIFYKYGTKYWYTTASRGTFSASTLLSGCLSSAYLNASSYGYFDEKTGYFKNKGSIKRISTGTQFLGASVDNYPYLIGGDGSKYMLQASYDSSVASNETLYWGTQNGTIYCYIYKNGGNQSTARTIQFKVFQLANDTVPDYNNKIGTYASSDRYYYQEDGTYSYIGSDSIDPTNVSYSNNNPTQGDNITVSITPSTGNKYGGTVYYTFEYSINNGSSWTTLINKITSTSTNLPIPYSATQIKVRVKASDNYGFTSSDYVTGSNITVKKATTVDPDPVDPTPSDSKHFYIGISGKARRAKKMYFGVNGKARKIKKIYFGVSGKARLVYSDQS